MAAPGEYVMTALRKSWIADKMASVTRQRCPVLMKISDMATYMKGGKEYSYAVLISGGNSSGSYLDLVNNLNKGWASEKNAEWVCKQHDGIGQYFYATSLNVKELRAYADRGLTAAYSNLISGKVSLNADSMLTDRSVDLHGIGFGELGNFLANTTADVPVPATGATVTVPRRVAQGLNVGRVIGNVAAAKISGLPKAQFYVSKKQKNSANTANFDLTIVPVDGTAKTIAKDDFCVLGGAVDADGPRFPGGFGALMPVETNATIWSYGARGSTYRGVDRSISDILNCGYIDASGTAKTDGYLGDIIADALAELEMQGGGKNGILTIVVNTLTEVKILNEIRHKMTPFQMVTNSAPSTPEVTNSMAHVRFAFGSILCELIGTPYAPVDILRIIDFNTNRINKYGVGFVTNSNAKRTTNAGQAADGDALGRTDTSFFENANSLFVAPHQLNIDDLYTVEQGDGDIDGPTVRVIGSMYGAYELTNMADHLSVRLPADVLSAEDEALNAKEYKLESLQSDIADAVKKGKIKGSLVEEIKKL